MSQALNYGLSYDDFQVVRRKISKQREFLSSETFVSSYSGKTKTYLDVSMSPNHSSKYYALILNKVSTYVSYNFNRNLVPVFLTITLDGFFRDFLDGNYDRWSRNRIKYLSHIPNNDRFGKYLSNIEAGQRLSSKDLYKILSFQWFRFLRSHTLQKLRRDGLEYNFIRVNEPHKNGVPHFHVLFYLPQSEIINLYREFKRFFPAPRNHKTINIRDNDRKPTSLTDDNGVKYYETQGFQWELKNPMGYILKYLLKSFRNVENGDEIDYLQAWYIHNRIPRIVMSRSLVSHEVYMKTSIVERDWLYLSEVKSDYYFKSYRLNINGIKFRFWKFIDKSGRTIVYNNGYLEVSHNGKVLKVVGKKKVVFKPAEPSFSLLNKIDLPKVIYYDDANYPINYDETLYLPTPDGVSCIKYIDEYLDGTKEEFLYFPYDDIEIPLLPDKLLDFFFKNFDTLSWKIFAYSINLIIDFGFGEEVGRSEYFNPFVKPKFVEHSIKM